MRFRVRDLLISDVANNQAANTCDNSNCNNHTVCGTITNTGPNGNTCQVGTACCYTACGGHTAKALTAPKLDDDFLAMLRAEIQGIQNKAVSEAHQELEPPQDKKQLEAVEAKLKAALKDVQTRIKAAK